MESTTELWKSTGLDVEARGRVAVLRIDRQNRMNAIDGPIARSIREAVQWIDATREIGVGVITGAGDRAFSAGADLKAGGSQVDGIGGWGGFVRLARKKPFIAAVNGVAVGGGLEIALACDFIYASEQARFGFPEVTIGVAAGAGGIIRFPRVVGLNAAKEFLLTGEIFDAATAKGIGLVNKVVPHGELIERVVEVAERIAKNSPRSLELTRWVADETWGADDEKSWRISDEMSEQVLGSPDAFEGTQAFLEKRAPVWTS
jgi:enoyl-CoA hydratase/carnithine racemase